MNHIFILYFPSTHDWKDYLSSSGHSQKETHFLFNNFTTLCYLDFEGAIDLLVIWATVGLSLSDLPNDHWA